MPTSFSAWSNATSVLTRVVVPLWVLTGALFKLYERNPGNLPKFILDNVKATLHPEPTGWYFILRTLIGLELFAVAVMVLIPRLSRAMAIFMLSCFCGILLGDMALRAENCGCFGSLPMKPWHMLVIDGSMLLAVLLTSLMAHRSRVGSLEGQPRTSLQRPLLASIPLLVVGLGVAFAVPEPRMIEQSVLELDKPSASMPEAPTTQTDASRNDSPTTSPATRPVVSKTPPPPADPTVNPTPKSIPGSWVTPNDVAAAWVGKPWREMELFQFMRRWPKNMDTGKHYIVFYGRTCDHCKEMFEFDLFQPLDAPVTAIEIPFSRTEMRPADAWPMPQTAPIEHLELPLGCSYVVTTPLSLRIEDGKITCAQEGGHRKCFGMER